MKIAFIERDLSPRSGSRRFIYEVTPRLQAGGHEVKIFTTKLDRKTCFPEFLSLPVEVVSIEEFRSFASRFLKQTLHRDMDYFWLETKAILEISRIVADWQPDVSIFHYAGEHWLQPYFYYLQGCSGAVCVHVVPPIVGPLALPFQRLTWRYRVRNRLLDLPPIKQYSKASLKKVGLIITHSRYLFNQAKKQGLIGSRKSAVVPLGVDHSRFHPSGEEEPFVLCLSRIHPDKSLELAVKAMKGTDAATSLIIAGDLDERYLWYKEKLEKLAEKTGVSDRLKVIVSPSSDQVVQLMQKCSVFLFPSMIDTFGLVVLEAMACSKTVIACRAGGVPELLDNCGFLLDPDVEQWQNTVKEVLSNQNLRLEMGKKAFERSLEYSWKSTADTLLNASENFLSR